MLILLLVKILLSYYLITRFKSEKLVKIVEIALDVIIVMLFIFVTYINSEIIVIWKLLNLVLFLIIIFLLYRLTNYGLKNSEKIIISMENRKKVILKITFWRNVYIENIKEFMEEIDIVFY